MQTATQEFPIMSLWCDYQLSTGKRYLITSMLNRLTRHIHSESRKGQYFGRWKYASMREKSFHMSMWLIQKGYRDTVVWICKYCEF